MHARQVREVCLQQLVGTDYQILLQVAQHLDTRETQLTVRDLCLVSIRVTGLVLCHIHFQGVGDRHGVEHGLQVVVAVRAFLHDVQP